MIFIENLLTICGINMCDHLKDIQNTVESSSYKLLYEFYVTCTRPGSSKKKTLQTSCHVCQKSCVGARLHACLSCVFIGCLKGHFKKHQEKHKFAMDLLFGAIYCFECNDYTYNEYFSDIAKRLQPSGQKKESIHWLPPKEHREFFKLHKPVKVNQSLVGLRGLYNLGFTCYINCIIQVFAGTPMMRNYFLSGRHSCQLEKDDCQACLLSEIFQELYSGKKDPLSLENFVFDLWKKSKIFCGSDGNDAEEFYEFFLEDLHKYCNEKDLEDMKKKKEMAIQNHTEDSTDFNTDSQEAIPLNHLDSKPCRCVIHQIFSGKYQIVTICSQCGVLSSTNGGSWSIKLHCGDSVGETKLTDCIKKCIQGTLNHENENIKCKKCEEGIEREQFLFKVLPNILCFHFSIIKKKTTRITFPEYLDMSPYTPETAKAAIWKENGVCSFKQHQSSKNMYILYAIVCHKGTQEGGHYYSYVRKSNTWYLCDDAKIKPVKFEEVLKCSGSLFFYIKEVLEYEKEHEQNTSVRRINNVNGYIHDM